MACVLSHSHAQKGHREGPLPPVRHAGEACPGQQVFARCVGALATPGEVHHLAAFFCARLADWCLPVLPPTPLASPAPLCYLHPASVDSCLRPLTQGVYPVLGSPGQWHQNVPPFMQPSAAHLP